jgi:hypothetical protein
MSCWVTMMLMKMMTHLACCMTWHGWMLLSWEETHLVFTSYKVSSHTMYDTVLMWTQKWESCFNLPVDPLLTPVWVPGHSFLNTDSIPLIFHFSLYYVVWQFTEWKSVSCTMLLISWE